MSFEHLPAVQAEIDELAQRFAAAGQRVFLVGGIVRDLWLGGQLDADSDIDLTTDARPKQIKALVRDWADAVWTQGERFGTIGCEKNGRAIEITTFRAEVYDPDSRKPEVAFGDDIHADLARRDFTVNAMAWELPVGRLIDPHDGVGDLQAGRLRTPLSPEVSFTDDPLRMIRAARFINRYDLEAAPELTAAATELRDRLDIVAVERVRDELDKLLSAESAAVGLEFLRLTGLLAKIIPGVDNDGIRAANAIDSPDPSTRWWLRFAALIAPLTATREHVRERAESLRFSRDTRHAVEYTVTGARALRDLTDGDSDEAIRRWVVGTAGHSGSAWQLGLAMHGEDALRAFGERWCSLNETEDVGGTDVPLSGDEIAELLGVAPGPIIGAAVKALQDHRFANGPFDATEARRVLATGSFGS